MLDTKQFVKKTHALSSSTVNVVCAKVTATTTTTQDMWDRMNNVSKRSSIDAYDRTFTDENNQPYHQDTSEEEDEEEEEDDDNEQQQQQQQRDDIQDESDLDIMGSDDSSSSSSSSSRGQTQTVKSNSSNLFQFHFEFGSKRPPRTTIQQDDQNESDEHESDLEGEPHSFLSSEQQDSDSDRSLFDTSSSSSNDDNEEDEEEDDDDEEEDSWSNKGKIKYIIPFLVTRTIFYMHTHTYLPYLTLPLPIEYVLPISSNLFY